MMTLEICANSYTSALMAQEAGAHRIELCSALEIGGLTPSYGELKKVVQALAIPVHVLIRPRGGDFNYSDEEFEVMKADIEICKSLGCSGIVSGVLHDDHTLDMARTQELVRYAQPLSFTFHRAFDLVRDPIETMEQCIALGVDRILTSGQQATAFEGIDLITTLQKLAKERIIILPGSGISPNTLRAFKAIKCKEVHASASKILQHSESAFFGTTNITQSDPDCIRELIRIIHEK